MQGARFHPKSKAPPRDPAPNGASRSGQGFLAAEHRSIARASAPSFPSTFLLFHRRGWMLVEKPVIAWGVVPGCHVSPACTWGVTSSSRKAHNTQHSSLFAGARAAPAYGVQVIHPHFAAAAAGPAGGGRELAAPIVGLLRGQRSNLARPICKLYLLVLSGLTTCCICPHICSNIKVSCS